MDRWDGESYRRALPLAGKFVEVAITQMGPPDEPRLQVTVTGARRVWFKPRIFAYVVAAWLFLIIANLLLIPGFYDVALRDLGLALGALALGRLSQEYSR